MLKRLIVATAACGTIVLAGCSNSTPAPTATVTVTQTPTLSGSEQKFVDLVRENTSIRGTDSQLVNKGHAICATLDNGTTVHDLILEAVVTMTDKESSDYGFLAGASIVTFCPEYENQIPGVKSGPSA